MVILVIGTIAAHLVALSLGFALFVEFRSLRSALTNANTTRRRIFKVESGRYRKAEHLRGVRAGVRTDYEERLSGHARAVVGKLESIRTILARVAATSEHASAEPATTTGVQDDDDANRLTSKVPEKPGAITAATRRPSNSTDAVAEIEGDDERTNVWTAPEAAHVRAEVEAGGASRQPRATPRAALSVPVAPPASAPPPRAPDAAIVAAGLGRPRSTRAAPHAPPVRVRSETLVGMPSPLPPASTDGDAVDRVSWPGLKQGGGVGISTRPSAGSAPSIAVPRFPATLVSMPAQRAVPAATQSTSVAPIGDHGLPGSDGAAEEAADVRRLGADEPTPRQARALAIAPDARGA